MLALQAAEGDEEGRPKERPEGEKQRRGDEVGPVPVLVNEQPSHHLPPDPTQRRQMTTKGARRMAPSKQWLGQCPHIHIQKGKIGVHQAVRCARFDSSLVGSALATVPIDASTMTRTALPDHPKRVMLWMPFQNPRSLRGQKSMRMLRFSGHAAFCGANTNNRSRWGRGGHYGTV